jgi:streptogramin lyase
MQREHVHDGGSDAARPTSSPYAASGRPTTSARPAQPDSSTSRQSDPQSTEESSGRVTVRFATRQRRCGGLWVAAPASADAVISVSTYTGPGISSPAAITAGPDGALWFTNFGNNSIGRISTSGVVTNYTDASILNPGRITAGPDGALWFTNTFGIGRITTTGEVTSYTSPGISGPIGITAGPDGAIWFTNGFSGSIGRISMSGVVTNYTGPGLTSAGAGP